MQKHSAASAARVLVFLVIAMVAAACGGSDDDAVESSATTDSPAAETETDSTNDGGDDGAEGDSGAGSSGDGEPADGDESGGESVAAVAASPGERECAYSVDELGGDADSAEEPAAEVELPPASKPEVGEDLFGEFDELIVTDLIEGTGDEAVAGATISMQYVGVLASDGTEFDSSWDRGAQPFEFALGQGRVIAGWDEGIEGMRVGGRRVLQIPSAQAYGGSGSGAVIGPNADLIFIVDMVGAGAVPDPAPPVPEDALGAFDQLEIVDLVEGEGCEARIGDIIAVNYVGVTAEGGVEFDSSWSRGEPFTLIAGKAGVIDGWNAGLVGMKVGGERLLQIPAAMAYGASGSGPIIGPDADLVFRIHLESLADAPYAHTVVFEGDAPSEVEITTVTEGSGASAEAGDILDTHIAVLFYKDSMLLQSTWEAGQTTQLALQEGALLPGLNEAVLGIKVGELRQIIVPPEVAYPDGVPPEAGLDEDDALVFILQPLAVVPG